MEPQVNPEKLLRDLKSPDSHIRSQATRELWNHWYQEAGECAEERLKEGVRLMDQDQHEDAGRAFALLIEDFPEFPEAHNKLATTLYLQDRYRESIAECEIALNLNPDHFGAWNGMGLCLYNIGRFDKAIPSFEKALAIQPYAEVNQLFIERCRRKLN